MTASPQHRAPMHSAGAGTGVRAVTLSGPGAVPVGTPSLRPCVALLRTRHRVARARHEGRAGNVRRIARQAVALGAMSVIAAGIARLVVQLDRTPMLADASLARMLVPVLTTLFLMLVTHAARRIVGHAGDRALQGLVRMAPVTSIQWARALLLDAMHSALAPCALLMVPLAFGLGIGRALGAVVAPLALVGALLPATLGVAVALLLGATAVGVLGGFAWLAIRQAWEHRTPGRRVVVGALAGSAVVSTLLVQLHRATALVMTAALQAGLPPAAVRALRAATATWNPGAWAGDVLLDGLHGTVSLVSLGALLGAAGLVVVLTEAFGPMLAGRLVAARTSTVPAWDQERLLDWLEARIAMTGVSTRAWLRADIAWWRAGGLRVPALVSPLGVAAVYLAITGPIASALPMTHRQPAVLLGLHALVLITLSVSGALLVAPRLVAGDPSRALLAQYIPGSLARVHRLYRVAMATVWSVLGAGAASAAVLWATPDCSWQGGALLVVGVSAGCSAAAAVALRWAQRRANEPHARA